MNADHDTATSEPIVSLIEWRSTTLTPDDARQVAAETTAAFGRIPGLLEIRFFGDFDTGTHYYLQVWQDQAALDAYMASESMFKIRDIAAPFTEGRPTRKLLADYSVR
jgi:quinol monooxygenase YgiN